MPKFVILAFGQRLDGRKRTVATICVNGQHIIRSTDDGIEPGNPGDYAFNTLDEAIAKRDELQSLFPKTQYLIATIID